MSSWFRSLGAVSTSDDDDNRADANGTSVPLVGGASMVQAAAARPFPPTQYEYARMQYRAESTIRVDAGAQEIAFCTPTPTQPAHKWATIVVRLELSHVWASTAPMGTQPTLVLDGAPVPFFTSTETHARATASLPDLPYNAECRQLVYGANVQAGALTAPLLPGNAHADHPRDLLVEQDYDQDEMAVGPLPPAIVDYCSRNRLTRSHTNRTGLERICTALAKEWTAARDRHRFPHQIGGRLLLAEPAPTKWTARLVWVVEVLAPVRRIGE